ncbi:MAG: energy-coupling factor transporter transmembrane protein EcfT [Desulfobacterales bacterium]|nr:MAG: energy-coupling factor transporter transmembrane protein EcfT [Desulfobacterales bacterium]
MKQIDPRTKLALGIMAIAGVLIARHPVTLMVAAGIVLIGVPVLGLWKSYVRTLPLTWPMLAMVFIIGWLFFDWKVASLLVIRLFALLTVSFIFFRLVGPEETGDALQKCGIPFEMAFILTTAMRYVPLIGQKIRSIIDAQRSRGIDLRPRVKNIRNFMALLMPLLVQSLILSDQLALAMESRGFGRKGRSSRRTYRLTAKEYGMMFGSLTLLAIFAWWERG